MTASTFFHGNLLDLEVAYLWYKYSYRVLLYLHIKIGMSQNDEFLYCLKFILKHPVAELMRYFYKTATILLLYYFF